MAALCDYLRQHTHSLAIFQRLDKARSLPAYYGRLMLDLRTATSRRPKFCFPLRKSFRVWARSEPIP